MPNKTWGLVRENLVARIGKNNYATWIEPLKLTALTNGVAHFEVPTTFFGNWVSRNYSDHILSHLQTSGQEVGRVEFSVARPAEPEARPTPAAPKAGAAEPASLRLMTHNAGSAATVKMEASARRRRS